MKKFAVVGASSGTGLAIVQQLAKAKQIVKAISRNPPAASEYVEPIAADITDVNAITRALDDETIDAVFFTVDIHGLFNSREKIRSIMYQGFINVMRAVSMQPNTKLILLSVIGAERPSWTWHLLNMLKPGMKKNIIDRENALKKSGIPFIICRAPKLNDLTESEIAIAATPPIHTLDLKRTIARKELASVMITAATSAPINSVWDVFADADGPRPAWIP